MPSSHSQFTAFFSTSLSFLLLLSEVHPSKLSSTALLQSNFLGGVLISVSAWFCTIAVAISRVYLNYHTVRQVVIGCAAGLLSAIVWFFFATYLKRFGWAEWMLNTDFERLLEFVLPVI